MMSHRVSTHVVNMHMGNPGPGAAQTPKPYGNSPQHSVQLHSVQLHTAQLHLQSPKQPGTTNNSNNSKGLVGSPHIQALYKRPLNPANHTSCCCYHNSACVCQAFDHNRQAVCRDATHSLSPLCVVVHREAVVASQHGQEGLHFSHCQPRP